MQVEHRTVQKSSPAKDRKDRLSTTIPFYHCKAGMQVLVFCGTPTLTLTPELETLGLQTPTLTPALKNLDSDFRPKNQIPTPTLGLIV